jgi:hypothetical protein
MFVMDDEKLIILVQGRKCLYNLQHNDCDNYFVKDNCWKEIAGERQGSDRETACERHCMCESALSVRTHCKSLIIMPFPKAECLAILPGVLA